MEAPKSERDASRRREGAFHNRTLGGGPEAQTLQQALANLKEGRSGTTSGHSSSGSASSGGGAGGGSGGGSGAVIYPNPSAPGGLMALRSLGYAAEEAGPGTRATGVWSSGASQSERGSASSTSMRAPSQVPSSSARRQAKGEAAKEAAVGGGAGSVCPPGKEHTGRWTRDEHALFLNALRVHGKEWKKVAATVGTRTVVQTRTHAQKYFQKLQKAIQQGQVADPESGLTGDEISYGLELMGGSVSTASTAAARREAKRQRAVQDALLLQQTGDGPSQGGSGYEGGLGPEEDGDDDMELPRTRKRRAPPSNGHDTMLDEDFDDDDEDHDDEVDLEPPGKHARRGDLDAADGLSFAASSGLSGMRIHVPLVHPYIRDSATPSPAACGKRKQAELHAAHILAATRNRSIKDEDLKLNRVDRAAGGVLSSLATPFGGETRPSSGADAGTSTGDLGEAQGPGALTARRRAAALQIINPESLDAEPLAKPRVGLEDMPETPWEGDLDNLESLSRLSTPHAATTAPPGLDLTPASAANPPASGAKRGTLHEGICCGDMHLVVDTLTQLGRTAGATGTLDAADSLGYTPLMSAANFPDADVSLAMASKLLDGGASAVLTDRNGNTALHWAAACGNEPTVEFLARRGAQVDARNVDGDTALHVASRIGHEGCIKCLINNAAWGHVRNAQDKTALDVAGDKAASAVIRMMVSAPYLPSLPPRSAERAAQLAGIARGMSTGALGDPAALQRMVDAYRDATLEALESASLDEDFRSLWAEAVPMAMAERLRVRTCLFTATPRSRTLVLYHEECMGHVPRGASDWEVPARLEVILDRIRNRMPPHEINLSNSFDKASAEVLGRAHSARFLRLVNNLAKSLESSGAPNVPFTPALQRSFGVDRALGGGDADVNIQELVAEISPGDGDTSFSPGSLQAARRAAGATVHAVDMVLLGRARNAFCIVRPPGHHAGRNGLLEGASSCGFCIFNNIAVAALHGIEAHRLDRVAIVDIDVHHGNGTEDIVRSYAHPEKLCFASIHLYDNPGEQDYAFFPGSGNEDQSKLNIVNIPLAPLWARKRASESKGVEPTTRDSDDMPSTRGSRRAPMAEESAPVAGRAGFRTAVSQRLLPTLRAFNPQLVLVSTGLDVCAGDIGNKKMLRGKSLRGLDLVEEDITWVTEKLQEVADICSSGRLVSVLEGGYGAEKPGRAAGKRSRQSAGTESGALVEGHGGEFSDQRIDGGLERPGEFGSVGADLDRTHLGSAAEAHLRALVDPYRGQMTSLLAQAES